MARQKEKDLYRALIDSRFSFMGKGKRTIGDIYTGVITNFPNLCDNYYFCYENCKSGNDQPEWKHSVRNALQRLKSISGHISFTGKRGLWKFQ